MYEKVFSDTSYLVMCVGELNQMSPFLSSITDLRLLSTSPEEVSKHSILRFLGS